MTVTGIICEYNPFHNGHLYHINETKKLCGTDRLIAVMSGDFTQRGEPAIISKYIRAKMALLAGCDIVLELPVRYSTKSAEGFASAAVNTLNCANAVDNICFGTEDGCLDNISKLSNILSNEPPNISLAIKQYTCSGDSYPKARMKAVSDYAEIEYSPNNILAVEYMKALANTSIKPFTIKRTDSGYNEADINKHSNGICSAFAIRSLLLNPDMPNELIKPYIPDGFFEIMHAKNPIYISPDNMSDILYSQIINNLNRLDNLDDVNSDLADRINNKINEFTSFTSFCRLLKTKQITYTRVSRALLHIALNIVKQPPGKYPVEYIRVLGFRKEASDLLKYINNNASVPVITRVARDIKLLNDNAAGMLVEDIRCSELYRYLSKNMDYNEYTHGMIII